MEGQVEGLDRRVLIGESMERFASIGSKVVTEQIDQILKWGLRDQSDGVWMLILMEEVGEAADRSLEQCPQLLREELIQVAAVAMSWIDNIDRRASGECDEIDGAGDEDSQ